MNQSVKLHTVTPDTEKTLAYIARVSSEYQENPDYARLLAYCVKHGHWSVFEHAHMTLEIETSRMISAQILRHRSFKFQEFSQRYSEPQSYVKSKARRQAEKNRQSSIDDLDPEIVDWWEQEQDKVWLDAMWLYDHAIDHGVAKECARAILPMSTSTRLYMTGDIRSWMHYIGLRTNPDTQEEHRWIAEQAKMIFIDQFPVVSEALGWI